MVARSSLSPIRLACGALLALLAIGSVQVAWAGSKRFDREEKRQLKFAGEMATKGLWREAMFQWQALLKDHPDDARLLNNIAVAHEALGELDRAIEIYERSVSVTADRKVTANLGLARKARDLSQPDEDPDVSEDEESKSAAAQLGDEEESR